MTRLALGTVQFGLAYGIANQTGQITHSAAKNMLQLAREKGIDTLDTAIAYGESEACLGAAGVQGFKLVTKLPAIPDSCRNVNSWVHDQIESSLDRLGASFVYGLLLHRSDQLLKNSGEALYEALNDLKKAGLVQKIGVSIYAPSELDALIPRFRFDLVQAPFNLVDRRLFQSGWLQRLKQEDVEIHTRSAFLQGLLLMPAHTLPPKFTPWHQLWDSWHKWLASHSLSAVDACLAYPLSFTEVDRVVIGADYPAQLQQIIDAAQRNIAVALPDLSCEDENLINPANWSRL